MKKIGIITLHGYHNYGNNLQNYALLSILEEFDYEVSTLIIEEKKAEKIKNKVKYIFKLNSSTAIKRLIEKPFKNNSKMTTNDNQILNSRKRQFKQFSKRFLNESFYKLDNKEDLQALEEFSFFITGSDQVWNPIQYQSLSIYFLTFAPREKRIAYAPSIGRNEIPQKYAKDYKNWLKNMSALSIREDAGAKLIKNLIGKEVSVLADPTMLLNKEEWLSISECAKNRPDTPYLLTYFLGGPTNETRKKLEKIAREKNMTIINLGDITEKETYETGPSEFLDYINNASTFFTDSFHGVVFSIIFQTPFVVYERQSSGPSMYSRIETILDNFDMRDREAEGFDQDIFSMDFSGTYEVLEREYEKSINYLKEALRIEE